MWVLLFLLFLGGSWGALLDCTPQGTNYVCWAEDPYTGPLSGELYVPDKFSFLGEDFLPVQPISVKLTRGVHDFGIVKDLAAYPRPLSLQSANCGVPLPVDVIAPAGFVFGANSSLDGSLILTAGSGSSSVGYHATDYPMLGASTRLYHFVCGSGNSPIGYVDKGEASMIVLIDHSVMRHVVTIESNVNGVVKNVEQNIYDLNATGVVVVSASQYPDAALYPFLWYNAADQTYYVPNANYSKNPIPIEKLSRNWATGASASIPAATAYERLVQARNAYCASKALTCTRLSDPDLLTFDKVSPLPSSLVVTGTGATRRLSTFTNTGNSSVVVKYTAVFVKAPPKVSIVGYSYKCGEDFAVLNYNNSGNPGTVKLSVNYDDTTTENVNYDIEYGVKTIRLYRSGMKKVCIGDDCTFILCAAPEKLESGSIWFNPDKKGLLAFQIIMVSVVGLFALWVTWKGSMFMRSKWVYWRGNGSEVLLPQTNGANISKNSRNRINVGNKNA